MNWIPLDQLNALRFKAAPRAPEELQRWCRNGDLPAKKIGGKWFVDLDAFDRPPAADPKASMIQDPDAVARRILDDIQARGRH